MSIPEYQLEWLRKHNPEVAEELSKSGYKVSCKNYMKVKKI